MNRLYHILLVDDDDVTNFLSNEMLRLYVPNLLIHTAINGKEALDFLHARIDKHEPLPDIILLDINMPVMDGWDFLDAFEAIRDKGFNNMSVCMFTSSVYFEDINRAKSYSSVKYIYSKPLDETKIKEIIALVDKSR